MIAQKDLAHYQGMSLCRGNDFIYVRPHILLQPYISCYTITFPSDMSDDYTILPSASSTLVVSVSSNAVFSNIRGVNTRPSIVGKRANKMVLLLLVEFHSGCLQPFIHIDQHELANSSFSLSDLDVSLSHEIEAALIKSESIDALIKEVDCVLLRQIENIRSEKTMNAIKRCILLSNGNISVRELSSICYYSEKHLRRLFLQYIGTSPKMYMRIVRINYALNLLQNKPAQFTDVAAQAGFFDEPHFIRDFKHILNLTPHEYMRNMSVFYNDNYKF